MLPGRRQESGQSGGNPADTRQGKKRLTRMLIGSTNYCKYAFADNSHSNHLPPRLKSPKAKKDFLGVSVLGPLVASDAFCEFNAFGACIRNMVYINQVNQVHDVNRVHQIHHSHKGGTRHTRDPEVRKNQIVKTIDKKPFFVKGKVIDHELYFMFTVISSVIVKESQREELKTKDIRSKVLWPMSQNIYKWR